MTQTLDLGREILIYTGARGMHLIEDAFLRKHNKDVITNLLKEENTDKDLLNSLLKMNNSENMDDVKLVLQILISLE